jgi:hypothetical protein
MAGKAACPINLTNDNLSFIVPSIVPPKRQVTCINLTKELKQCAVCPNELSTGTGEKSWIYALSICACVCL